MPNYRFAAAAAVCWPGTGPSNPSQVPLLAVSVAGTEFVLVHLGQRLFEVPVIVVEAIDSAHDSRAMAAAGAVHEELAVSGSPTTFKNWLIWSMLG
jgi:hypothetical protein